MGFGVAFMTQDTVSEATPTSCSFSLHKTYLVFVENLVLLPLTTIAAALLGAGDTDSSPHLTSTQDAGEEQCVIVFPTGHSGPQWKVEPLSCHGDVPP